MGDWPVEQDEERRAKLSPKCGATAGDFGTALCRERVDCALALGGRTKKDALKAGMLCFAVVFHGEIRARYHPRHLGQAEAGRKGGRTDGAACHARRLHPRGPLGSRASRRSAPLAEAAGHEMRLCSPSSPFRVHCRALLRGLRFAAALGPRLCPGSRTLIALRAFAATALGTPPDASLSQMGEGIR